MGGGLLVGNCSSRRQGAADSTRGADELLSDFWLDWFSVSPLTLSSSASARKEQGLNKKPKKFKTVWHGFRGILKLSGRVNQASLKLSSAFSNTVC